MSSNEPTRQNLELFHGDPDEESDAQRELYTLVGRAIAIWTVVEHELFYLFVEVAHPKGISGGAAASFHSLYTFRQKLEHTNVAIKSTFHQGEYDDLRRDWADVQEYLSRANRKRNKLAHGFILTLDGVPGAGDRQGWHPSANLTQAFAVPEGRQAISPPILTAQDIKAITEKLSKAGARLLSFRTESARPAMQTVARVEITTG